MKTVDKIKITIVLLVLSMALSASDFKTIYDRMYYDYLGNPSPTSVESILHKMQYDGSFFGMNYKTQDGTPRSHPIWLTTLAQAYKSPSNKYYRDPEVRDKFLSGLRFWIKTNHNVANWWYRYIAYPKETTKCVILMSDEIKKDPELFDQTMKYLRWSYEHSDSGRLTGANGADIIIGSMAASVLTENDAQMMDYKDKMTGLLTIQPAEGILSDYLFGQHCGHGRQLYFCNYGKEFVNSMMYYLEFCNGTKYQTPGVDLLQDLFVKGVQWIFYAKHYDPNNSGRYDSSDQYYEQIKGLAQRLQKLDVSDKTEVQKIAKRISGDNSLSGNRMFWRFDYMINRRPNYMVSSRMTSTRTVGNEAGNGDGEYNYYAANGVNYIFVNGDEYDGKYFKQFNNRQFPGITAEQDNRPLPIPNWGENAGNNNAFAGGASDSTYGACGMILDRRGLTAHKAWFYFDDEFVCLGAGITESDGIAPVYTTINQCNKSGAARYCDNKKNGTLRKTAYLHQPEWVLEGNVGYFNLDPASVFKLKTDSALFSLNIDHGVNPANKTYAYVVYPAMKSTKDATGYFKHLPVEVLSNTPDVQAVRQKNLHITEIVFTKAGELATPQGTLTVDAPCVLLWKENDGTITLGNPYAETNNPEKISVKVDIGGKVKVLDFVLPTGEFAGKSGTQKINK